MKIIVNALGNDDNPPSFMYITALALCLVIPFGIAHLLAYLSNGWGVGGGARKLLLSAMMSSFLNFKEEDRVSQNIYQWTAVFNVEVLTLVNDGYMQFFTLIAAIGKVMFLALFMFYLAVRNYLETGEGTLFVSIAPFFLVPPIIVCYLEARLRGREEARQGVVNASVRLRHFAGECVSHYRTIADYWSRPTVLDQTVRLTQHLNEKLSVQGFRTSNDEAFFGWLIKAVEFCTISGLGALVIRGQIQIGTFAAVLSGLLGAAREFQGAYRTVMTMQACYPCLWKCVEYLNLPNDSLERRDKLAEMRRMFVDHIHTEQQRNPEGIPEDRVLLSMENVSFAYKSGNSHIFRDLTVTFNQGEFVALVGPHNSGKDTFLQILCGIILPSTGNTQVPPHLRVLHLRYDEQMWDRPLSDTLFYGWMAANGVTRFEDLDEGVIEKGLHVCKQLGVTQSLADQIEGEARSRTEPLNKGNGKPTEVAFARTFGLSSDSRHKLQLACALLAHPEVLVIHKPVAHAGLTDGALMMEVLRRYVDERGLDLHVGDIHARRPRTCIVSMEKPIFLDKVHRVLELDDGQAREMSQDLRIAKELSTRIACRT